MTDNISDFDYYSDGTPFNSTQTINFPGWNTSQEDFCSSTYCKFTIGSIANSSSLPNASTSPNVYGIGLDGGYNSGISEARLIFPKYEIPLNESTFFTSDHWSCAEDNWDGGGLHQCK